MHIVNILKIALAGAVDSVTFDLTSLSSIQWCWALLSETVYLDVFSDYDSLVPWGRTYYIPGTAVACSVTTPYYTPTDSGVRYNCTGYTRQFILTVKKEPFQTYGLVRINTTTAEYAGSLSVWVDEGDSALVTVSTNDGSSEHRFSFDHFSDWGDYSHWTAPVSAPTTIAYYNDEYKLYIVKEPRETYGSIQINDSVYSDADEILRWLPAGESLYVAVSSEDVGPDSVWYFNYWNDDLADTMPVFALSSMDTAYYLTAHYSNDIYILDVWVSYTLWDLDTMEINEVRMMADSEVIKVTNLSTVSADFGLVVLTPDTLTDWAVGTFPGLDRFTIQAVFNTDSTTPDSFYYVWDCVKSSVSWSNDMIFGSGGYNIEPGHSNFLWLRFNAPYVATVYERPEKFILKVQVQAHIE